MFLALRDAHDTVWSAHAGIEKTRESLYARFTCPRLGQYAVAYVSVVVIAIIANLNVTRSPLRSDR